MKHGLKSSLIVITMAASFSACRLNQTAIPTDGAPTASETLLTTTPSVTSTSIPPTPTSTQQPPCYLTTPPADINLTYAIQGWQQFAAQINLKLDYFYFPTTCPPGSMEQDGQNILFGNIVPQDAVGLVILNPVEEGVLGTLYQHLIQHEYWQMGPEDYPALLDNSAGVNQNLVFLRVNELNGDNTIIGSPLTVMESLAEHEYIHIAQSRNNPDFAQMVWTDKDYQAFIEGYANIGNASSQRYYFETKAAIEILQNLDLMNRNNRLQEKIAEALHAAGKDTSQFIAANVDVYDRHVQVFFLRVGGQAYLDGLKQGEISPLLLFTRAGSGDMTSYAVLKTILK